MEATKQPTPDDEGPRSRPKHRGRRLMRTQSKEETLMAQTAAVKQSKANARAQKQLGHNTWRKAFMQHYWLYIMMLPALLYMIIFNYLPMTGLYLSLIHI